jgi:hypothetical protein
MAKVPCFNLNDRNRMSLEEPTAVAQDEDVRAGTIEWDSLLGRPNPGSVVGRVLDVGGAVRRQGKSGCRHQPGPARATRPPALSSHRPVLSVVSLRDDP